MARLASWKYLAVSESVGTLSKLGIVKLLPFTLLNVEAVQNGPENVSVHRLYEKCYGKLRREERRTRIHERG